MLQVFQPFAALLSRWLVVGMSYFRQRRLILSLLGLQSGLTWLMAPALDACNALENRTVAWQSSL